jgi:hypothetical protein
MLIGIVLEIVGAYGVRNLPLSADWYTDLSWLVEVLLAVLVVVRREPRWGALLVGMLAWEWSISTTLWTSDAWQYLASGWYFIAAGNALLLVTQVVAAVAVLRAAGRTRRAAAPYLLMIPFAVASVAVALNLLVLAYQVDSSASPTVGIITLLGCAAGVVLAGLSGPHGGYVMAGWLAGAAQATLSGVLLLRHNVPGNESNLPTWAAALLVVDIILGCVITLARGQRPPARPALPAPDMDRITSS